MIICARKEDLIHKSGVYKITNIETHGFYVGSSKDLWKRNTQHEWYLKNNRHCSKDFQKEYNEFGSDSFKFEVVEYCEPDIRRDREQIYLTLYKDNDRMYNKSTNAYTNNYVSEEQRKQMSESRKGRVLSEEHKKKISESNKGRRNSEEAIRKQRETMIGRKLTDDHKKHLSEARMGKYTGKDNPKAKTTYVYDLEGNLLYIFDTQKEFTEYVINEGIVVSKSKNPIDTVSSNIRQAMRHNRPFHGMIVSFELLN